MSKEEFDNLTKCDRGVYVKFAWIDFNINRPDLVMYGSDGTIKIKNKKIQNLQEQERMVARKVKL